MKRHLEDIEELRDLIVEIASHNVDWMKAHKVLQKEFRRVVNKRAKEVGNRAANFLLDYLMEKKISIEVNFDD